MPRKSVSVSVRLSQNDARFLERLAIDDAATPSEKLRAVIAEARRRERGTQEYASALRLAQEGMAPTLRIIRENEVANGMHSELVSRLGEWLPECAAFLVACNGAQTELDGDQLKEIEDGLAQRVLILMQSVLQMGLTDRSPCYRPDLFKDSLDPVLDLAEVIVSHRATDKRRKRDD